MLSQFIWSSQQAEQHDMLQGPDMNHAEGISLESRCTEGCLHKSGLKVA